MLLKIQSVETIYIKTQILYFYDITPQHSKQNITHNMTSSFI